MLEQIAYATHLANGKVGAEIQPTLSLLESTTWFSVCEVEADRGLASSNLKNGTVIVGGSPTPEMISCLKKKLMLSTWFRTVFTNVVI